ncbi:cellulose-binding family II protein [Thozetella sp. PMI_491]|nr:cellulose-binding family II protein [Thozetella sp. PMI_491]
MRPVVVSYVALAFAASSGAINFSHDQDGNGDVWNKQFHPESRSEYIPSSNRPTKRQSGWNPPSNLVTPLKQVWDHCLATYTDLFGFRNYGWDQIMATNGTLKVCVRWDSNVAVTEAQRMQVATALNKQYQNWFKWLYGYDNFPFSSIPVSVVGWAVRDKSLLQGSTSGIDVYTNKDESGVPQCDPACGRFFHQTGDYSSCPGGATHHYDNSLWLTAGLTGGFGGDWGQNIGSEYFMGILGSDSIHILEHEMGHTFGLDDYWTPTGVTNFIMLAGSSTVITDFDGWMLRNWWYELSRNRGWQTGSGGSGTTTKTTTTTKTQAATPTATALAQQYGQCGGIGWTGPTVCVSPYTCKYSNDWYSQCL